MRKSRKTMLWAVVATILASGAASSASVVAVSDVNADRLLKPGDVMFKLLNDSSGVATWGTAIDEHLTKQLEGKWDVVARKGDANSVHVVFYVGHGKTAEAHRKDAGDAAAQVGSRDLEQHAGYLFYVYRPKNQGLATAAAQIAENWATGRMGYLLPLRVPFENSDFGPKGHEEALYLGQQAEERGGPRSYKDMFCSQFVISVYQAAIVRAQLERNPRLSAHKVEMPYSLAVQASHTSPFIFNGHLADATQAKHGGDWEYVGEFLVQASKK